MKINPFLSRMMNFLFSAERVTFTSPPNSEVADVVIHNLDSIDDTRELALVDFIQALKNDFNYPVSMQIVPTENAQHYIFTYDPDFGIGMSETDLLAYLATCVSTQLSAIDERIADKQAQIVIQQDLRTEVLFLFNRLTAEL